MNAKMQELMSLTDELGDDELQLILYIIRALLIRLEYDVCPNNSTEGY